MSVVDASFVADALVTGGQLGDTAQERLSRMGRVHAPHLLDAEVVSVIRRLRQAEAISTPVANAALGRLATMRVVRHPFLPFQARVWELRENATPYDAWYLAIAEAVGASLVTTDPKLATVPGIRCDVEVVVAR